MYFKNISWNGKIEFANFNLDCDVCGKSLGYHHGKECRSSPIAAATFEAHGHTWTRHTPGDPMPCRGDAWVYTLLSDFTVGALGLRYIANTASWTCAGEYNAIIGWRFADSSKPEVACTQIQGREEAVSSDVLQYQPGTTADLSEYIECAEDESEPELQPAKVVGDGITVRIRCDGAGVEQGLMDGGVTYINAAADPNCAMLQDDMPIAAVEDSALTPSQRRHWNEMEAKQAAREQLKHDAEAKALQERAEQLSDAGKAMDRVNQDHGHKLGWQPGQLK